MIGALGIDEDNRVVPAGVHASDFAAAARVYWTLKVAGLAQVVSSRTKWDDLKKALGLGT